MRRSSAGSAGLAALGAAHRRYLVVETAISIGVNAAVSAAFAWGLFRGVTRVPLRGAQGIGADLVPTVFMITLMLTLALTLVTRRPSPWPSISSSASRSFTAPRSARW